MPDPKNTKTTTPAEVVSEALAGLGYTTMRAQARVLGEDLTCYSRYTRGQRSPPCSKVDGWIATLKRKGIALVLKWDDTGCKVRSIKRRKRAA